MTQTVAMHTCSLLCWRLLAGTIKRLFGIRRQTTAPMPTWLESSICAAYHLCLPKSFLGGSESGVHEFCPLENRLRGYVIGDVCDDFSKDP